MAEKTKLKVFAKTENIQEKTTPRGVHLTAAELARLDKIADELGIARHKLLRYSVLWFMEKYEAGAIQTETRRSLPGL
jgi:hypothetical protein